MSYWYAREYLNISELVGKTLIDVSGMHEGSDMVVFTCSDGSKYQLYHKQDCCEHVRIEDVCGDVEDLLNTPIVVAEEVDGVTHSEPEGYVESYTWTFYKLDTIKGGVTIRWLGESNGYYSESVSFSKCV